MSEQTTVLDLDALLDSVDGDRDLLDELVPVFVEQVPGWLSDLKLAVSSGDAEKTFRVAHGVKGSVAFFRVDAARWAAELETIARQGSLDGAPAALDQLEASLEALMVTLGAAPWRR